MRPGASRVVALAGLAGLVALLLSPPGAGGMLGAAPLAALIVTGMLAPSGWQIATAILMLPYFSFGVMEAIANPAGRSPAILFAALTVTVFLAALDSLRRRNRRPKPP